MHPYRDVFFEQVRVPDLRPRFPLTIALAMCGGLLGVPLALSWSGLLPVGVVSALAFGGLGLALDGIALRRKRRTHA